MARLGTAVTSWGPRELRAWLCASLCACSPGAGCPAAGFSLLLGAWIFYRNGFKFIFMDFFSPSEDVLVALAAYSYLSPWGTDGEEAVHQLHRPTEQTIALMQTLSARAGCRMTCVPPGLGHCWSFHASSTTAVPVVLLCSSPWPGSTGWEMCGAHEVR